MARRLTKTVPVSAPKVSVDTDYLTATEVCERLKVSRQTLSYWRSKNTGPLSFAVGNSVRYPVAEFEAWLSEQMRDTARGGVRAAV